MVKSLITSSKQNIVLHIIVIYSYKSNRTIKSPAIKVIAEIAGVGISASNIAELAGDSNIANPYECKFENYAAFNDFLF
ncbi:MAG: hypothetical protein ACR2KZ_20650 [Segetibacter sp.]